MLPMKESAAKMEGRSVKKSQTQGVVFFMTFVSGRIKLAGIGHVTMQIK